MTSFEALWRAGDLADAVGFNTTRRKWAYLASVMACGAVVLLFSVISLVHSPPDSTWYVLLAMAMVTGWAIFRLPVVPVSFSLSDTFTITAALLFGPAAGAVTVALESLLLSFRFTISPRTPTRVLFNVTAPALAMWLSAQLFFLMSGTGPLSDDPATMRNVLAPLGVFVATYFVLNTGLVAAAVAGEQQAPLLAVWRKHFLPLWLTYFVGASVAGVLVLLMAARVTDLEALTLILPLMVLVFVAFRGAVDRLRERSAYLATLRSYEAALRSTADAVIVTDRDNRVRFMNPVAERLTQWREEVARGRLLPEVCRLVDPATGEVDDGTAAEGYLKEYLLVNPDGGTCLVEETHARIRDEYETAGGLVWIFRDITERKALEAEREALLRSEQQAREAADTANRLKDEFLATLSHELRTPATAILGWTRLLRAGSLDAGRIHKAFEALERSARAQTTVLNDLLDVSRMVRGTLQLQVRRIDLLDPVRDALDTIDPAARAKDLDVSLDVGAAVTTIDADPDRLRQVFWNLLSNAIKFTPRGGQVRVVITRDEQAVRIEVRDTGCGIEPRFLPFVFERFRQADASSTREHGGLGLGLAIARHIVELHGGTIAAHSDGPGQGARFVIRLPGSIRRRESDLPQALT